MSRHIVLLFEPDNVGSVSQAKEIGEVASRVGVRITPIELRQPSDIEPAFKRAAAIGAQAFIVTTGGTIASQRQAIADRIIRLKTPAMFANSEWPEAGGLMSYGPSFNDNFRRAAVYVDKILKGANPGEIPIEQPTKFELIVNMKTSTGVTFPESSVAGECVIEWRASYGSDLARRTGDRPGKRPRRDARRGLRERSRGGRGAADRRARPRTSTTSRARSSRPA